MWSWRRRRGSPLILGILREGARREPGVEAHVHVVFPQDPVADAGRHGRCAYVFGSAARRIKVVWKGHGRAEELGEFSRRASVHALQRHGEVERIEDTLRDLKTNLARRDGDADVARQVAQEAPTPMPCNAC